MADWNGNVPLRSWFDFPTAGDLLLVKHYFVKNGLEPVIAYILESESKA